MTFTHNYQQVEMHAPHMAISLTRLFTDGLEMIAAAKRNPEYCDVILQWCVDSANMAERQEEINIYMTIIEGIQHIKANHAGEYQL